MSLLNRQQLVDSTMQDMVPLPITEPEIQQTQTLVDITIQQLADVVNLDVEEDPFVIYLQQYTDSIDTLLECIAVIKDSEKQLKKRRREASRLLQSLFDSNKVTSEIELDMESKGYFDFKDASDIDNVNVNSFLDFSK